MTETGGFCTNCGAASQPGQNYCGVCGRALGAARAATFKGATPGSPVTGPGDDVPYPRDSVIGAVVLTIFVPFVALIAALLLIAIIAFSSILGTVGPSGCKEGIDITVPPSYESADGKHWVGTFACMNGGTMTKPVPASQVPGGG